MSPSPRLHIVYVNFRTPALTIRSVKSVLAHGIATPDQITIVDNCSGDDSLEIMRAALPRVEIAVAPRNGGFGAGINHGSARLEAEYLLVLNPDTYFESDSISEVLAAMDDDQGIGLAGLGLVNPDGTRQYSARRFYALLDVVGRRVGRLQPLLRERLERHLMTTETDAGKPFDAEWVLGTGFIMRRHMFAAIGGMDEAYFLYMEDVDLCARVWASGHRVVCFPNARLVHDHQRSSATSPLSRVGRAHLHSLRRFARKFGLPLVSPPGVQRVVRKWAGSSSKRAQA